MLVIYNANLVDKNISQKGYIVCDKGKIISVNKNDGENANKNGDGKYDKPCDAIDDAIDDKKEA